MAKTVRKRLIIRLPLAPNSSTEPAEDAVFVGATRLSTKRKRQPLADAVRESVERNQEALRKLAHR